jgi:hypothetical protein
MYTLLLVFPFRNVSYLLKEEAWNYNPTWQMVKGGPTR